MEKIIQLLKEKREKSKNHYIHDSLIVYNSKNSLLRPNAERHLEDILDLNMAISVLENNLCAKNNPQTN